MWQLRRVLADGRSEHYASELFESSSRTLIVIFAVLYLGWHFFAAATWPASVGRQMWLPTALFVPLAGAAYLLVARHFLIAQLVWLACLLVTITVTMITFGLAELAIFFALLPLMAILTIGWPAAVVTELAVALVLAWLIKAGTIGALTGSMSLTVLVSGVLLGIVGWITVRTLFTALQWALSSWEVAQSTARSAREHRAGLLELNIQLDRANHQLDKANAALTAAWRVADEAERFKTEFITNISHEMRTPLNLIIGFSQMMVTSPESYGGKPLPSGYRSDLHTVYRSAQHLLALVDDVIDLTRIDAGKIPLVRYEIELGTLVQETAEIVRKYIAAKGLELRLEVAPGLPTVWADRQRIRQVLLNLLTNGARHTRQGGITVTIVRQNGELCVQVRDTGPGIAPENQKWIFTQFHTTEQPSPEWHSGSGLGLPISKQLVALHGGRMGLESALGEGSAQYGPHHRYFVIDPQQGYLYLTGMTHGLMFVDVTEWLYTITGNDAYRDFGVWLYHDYCSVPGHFKNDDLKLEHLHNRGLGLRGHAAHAAEHLRALLWSAFVTGDEYTAQGVAHTFRKLIRYIVPSGALIGDEDIQGLPLPDVGYEYCTMFELMNSLLSATEKFGVAGYSDWAENIALNAGQGARLANGTAICYMSKENRFRALAEDLDTYSADLYQFSPTLAALWQDSPERHWQHAGRFKYSPTHEDVAVCCNPNAVRFMPHYVSRMWLRSTTEDALVAHLYGPCALTTQVGGRTVVIEEQTDYPFTEEIRFVIRQADAGAFALLLRLPSWATDYQVTAAGAEIRQAGSYLRLSKHWRTGDEITLVFATQFEFVCNPNGEYTVRRGPLQYAMPIEHTLCAIKGYPLPAFHDFDVLPQDLRQAYAVPILDAAQTDWGCTFRRHATIGDTPWDAPPVTVALGEHTLVPLGCTVLRRSTLPRQAVVMPA